MRRARHATEHHHGTAEGLALGAVALPRRLHRLQPRPLAVRRRPRRGTRARALDRRARALGGPGDRTPGPGRPRLPRRRAAVELHLPRRPIRRAPGRADLALPPRTPRLPAPSQHRRADLADRHPDLWPLPRRPAAPRRHGLHRHRQPTAGSGADRPLDDLLQPARRRPQPARRLRRRGRPHAHARAPPPLVQDARRAVATARRAVGHRNRKPLPARHRDRARRHRARLRHRPRPQHAPAAPAPGTW
jgi:hypothetical protein